MMSCLCCISAASHLPTINLTITPTFGPLRAQNDSFLLFDMVFEQTLQSGEVLLTLPMVKDRCPTQQYDEGSLFVSDDNGPLEVLVETVANDRTFKVSRECRGKIHVQFRAVPRLVDQHTQIVARIDLRVDQGGLMGGGQTMIPMFPEEKAKEFSRMTVEWNLAELPDDRAVWTFGEGPQPVTTEGPAFLLRDSYYAVGAIKSYPAIPKDDDVYGFYWLGDAPASILEAAQINEKIFPQMSEFFSDPVTPSNPYRVFLRNAYPARGNGGTALARSYMLEYDATGRYMSSFSLLSLLSHEMVHN